jgi:hypothetical protein
VTPGPAAATTEGQRRIAAVEISGGQLEISTHTGRVELAPSAGDQLRVRWTVPKGRVRRVREPQFRFGGDGLRIRCRRARLRVDIPAGLAVRVRVASGQITSWGADGDLQLTVRDGSVACRELRGQVVSVRAPKVNLHFASSPRMVDVECGQAIVVLPGGPYALSVPALAEVTVPRSTDAAGGAPRIRVHGAEVKVLASSAPLRLTEESADS